MKLLPQIMLEGGCFTANLGKTNYNFVWDNDSKAGRRRDSPVEKPVISIADQGTCS